MLELIANAVLVFVLCAVIGFLIAYLHNDHIERSLEVIPDSGSDGNLDGGTTL